MYNVIDRNGHVLASVGAYVRALSIVTWYARQGVATNLQGFVKDRKPPLTGGRQGVRMHSQTKGAVK